MQTMKNNFNFGFIALMLFSIICIQVNAQTPHIDFTYDAVGNRVLRQYTAQRVMNDTTKNNDDAKQIAAQYGISVYPNPSTNGDAVNVKISLPASNSAETETATISLLDNTGKLLFTQKQTTVSSNQIDLSKYTAGVYYVKVMIDKKQLFYRIVKVQ